MHDATPNRSRLLTRLGALVAVGALVFAVAACSSDEPSADPAPSTETTTTLPPVLWPLTGLPAPDTAATQQSALVAKIDNSEDARPHGGLENADMVYEIWVEGITRFAAVYHSDVPDRVGPVRSARSTDVDLVANLGVPLLVWSGGNANVIGEVGTAAAEGVLVNAGYDAATFGYQRVPDRYAPHNLFADLVALREALSPGGDAYPRPLFTFADPSASASTTTSSTTSTTTAGSGSSSSAAPTTSTPLVEGDPLPGIAITFGGGSTVTYVWDAEAKCNRRFDNGVPFVSEAGTPICPRNVVVQFTEYGPSTADSRSPQAYTIGSGGGLVYANGISTLVSWNRPDRASGPNLTTPSGKPATLVPGTTWVGLPPVGQPTGPISAEEAAALLAG